MVTYNPKYESTYSPFRGLRGFVCTVIVRVMRALKLRVASEP